MSVRCYWTTSITSSLHHFVNTSQSQLTIVIPMQLKIAKLSQITKTVLRIVWTIIDQYLLSTVLNFWRKWWQSD
jgi:hypothetical protein